LTDAEARSDEARAEEEATAARARLLQRGREAALGMLAAGLAHEMNNPAAFLLLGIDLLDRLLRGPTVAMDPDATARASELLKELREATGRIVDISRDLGLFTSAPAPPGERRAIIDVNRTVNAALNLVRGRILERAQIARSFGEVAPVVMDEADLGHVIVALLVRAAESIPAAGAHGHTITVATRSDGLTVTIEVRDTGDRLPREDLERLVQPFSFADADAGLGLAVCRDIVERAGGKIWVESPLPEGGAPGAPSADRAAEGASRGTRFVIELPAAGEGRGAA
jgi:signal transduction histidine kinase